MSPLTEKEVEERLTAGAKPAPPADLADRIKSEIPDPLTLVRPERPGRPHAKYWMLAASLAIAGVSIVLLRNMDTSLAPREAPVSTTEASEGSSAEGLERSSLNDRDDQDDQARLRKLESTRPDPGLPSSQDSIDALEPAQPKTQTPSAEVIQRPSRLARETESRDELREQLRSLGYVGDGRGETVTEVITVTGESPPPYERKIQSGVTVTEGEPGAVQDRERAELEPRSAPPARVPRAEAPKPRAKRIAIPDATPAVTGAPTASTGGTAEPNDEPYGDMFFKNYGVNPFIDTEDDRLSTFGLDVDTGSYGLVRGYLEDGNLPAPEAVRVEEVVNYFDYGDPAPKRGDFALTAQAGPAPFASGPRYRLVRFNVRARDVADADRKPATLVFVVDVSGSMNRESRLGLVKKSLFLLLDRLRADDRVGLVVYGTRGRVLLEPTGDLEAIRDAIERLSAEGSTNAEEGLTLAYDLAAKHRREGAIHRVILCSDGVANVGRTGPESILARIGNAAGSGIELTTVGFGMGNYNDVLMEQLADKGDGNYAYVDDITEARRIFVENLTGTLQTVAADAKVQVDFDPRTVSRYRLLGYENRAIADQDFRNDSVDAGEIGSGHSVTALYEIKLHEEAPLQTPLATLSLRYRSKASGEVEETAIELARRDVAGTWDTAPRELRLAALAAEFAEILRGSYWAKDGDLDDVFRRAQELLPEFPGNTEVAELVALIGKAARLMKQDAE